MRALAAVCLAALFAVPSVRAAEATPAPAQSSLAVQLARFQLPEAIWKKTIDGLKAQMKPMLEQGLAEQKDVLPPGFVGETFDDCLAILLRYPEVLDMVAGIYAKHYSDAELREIMAFYATPVGLKTIGLQPEIAQDITGQMMAMVQQRMPIVLARTQERIERYLAEHPELAPKPAAAPAEPPAKKS